MNKQEIQDIIESKSLSTAIFEAELCTDLGIVPEFDALYEGLPEWVSTAIDNSELEIDDTWDAEYWGSDSVVQICIQPRNPGRGTQELRDLAEKLGSWKDEHEKEYSDFCGGMEQAIWKYVQQQENFDLFDAVMCGK
jgi:hypothetical protein